VDRIICVLRLIVAKMLLDGAGSSSLHLSTLGLDFAWCTVRALQSGPVFLDLVFSQEDIISAPHIQKVNSGGEERQHACNNTTTEKGTGLAIATVNPAASIATWQSNELVQPQEHTTRVI
jgi:kynureninase